MAYWEFQNEKSVIEQYQVRSYARLKNIQNLATCSLGKVREELLIFGFCRRDPNPPLSTGWRYVAACSVQGLSVPNNLKTRVHSIAVCSYIECKLDFQPSSSEKDLMQSVVIVGNLSARIGTWIVADFQWDCSTKQCFFVWLLRVLSWVLRLAFSGPESAIPFQLLVACEVCWTPLRACPLHKW